MATTIYGSEVIYAGLPDRGSEIYGSDVLSAYPYPRPEDVPVKYRNKVWDTVAGDWVFWETVYPDPGQQEYSGPGKGTQLQDYGVEAVVYGRYQKV
jgi:hypothetical protein